MRGRRLNRLTNGPYLIINRGWENRTPTKGFGDPYHTIWPIPYIIYLIHSKLHTDIRLSKFFKSNILAYSYATSKDSRSISLRFISLCFATQNSSWTFHHLCRWICSMLSCSFIVFLRFLRLSPRPISNSQLHVLPHFHLCPIYLVVFKGSYSRRRDISSWGGLHA